jgi:hypothetical protein
MKIDLTKSFIIILHLEKAIDRLEKIKKITDKIPDYKIWVADDVDKFNEKQRKKYLDLKFFHRLPNKYSKEDIIIKRCSCSLHHMEILKYIIDNKIDNVIVFEDDAFQIDDDLIIDYNDDTYYYYLGYRRWTNDKNKFAGQHAIYYKSHERVKEIYDVIKNPKKFTHIDYLFARYIQPKFKYQFKQLFIQSGISSIDNKMQDKLFLE